MALREGRGELARAEAALARVDALRRDLVDTLRAELETALLQREAAYARWLLMDEAVRAAEEVARLEGRAFALGSSD
ncbi:MAG: TolC family protein, partial [bacterium]